MTAENPLEDLKQRAKVGAERLRLAAVFIEEALSVCKPINEAIENGDGRILNTKAGTDLTEAEENLFTLMEQFE